MSDLGLYHQDAFYDIENKPEELIEQILRECCKLSYHCRVDELDCSKSFCRRRIEMSFEDIMNLKEGKRFYIFIHRRGYERWKDNRDLFNNRWCLETGFRLMGRKKDYFLWINCNENHIEELVAKYKLKRL